MKSYIGAKIIQATPMSNVEFANTVRTIPHEPGKAGYLVVYPDGYKSWSPKETFETAYRLITNGEERLIECSERGPENTNQDVVD